jgi:hypothetical protein
MSVAPIRDGNPIENVIRRAADRTGVDFGFLLGTARRESSLNPKARAGTSSAAGLFQFVEQTWLSQMQRHGAKHGYGRLAASIERGSDGRLRCESPEARRAVMEMRFDATCSSLMAGELASDHAAYLKGRIGRDATGGELYAAHFLGPKGAAKLIEAQERSPGASAAGLFPQAAAANRSIFHPKGRTASVAEVYANLTRTNLGGARSSAAPAQTPTAPAPAPAYRIVHESVVGPAPRSAGTLHALEGRLQQMRQEQSLLQRVLNGGEGGAPAATLFDAGLLSVLAGSRDDDPA